MTGKSNAASKNEVGTDDRDMDEDNADSGRLRILENRDSERTKSET